MAHRLPMVRTPALIVRLKPSTRLAVMLGFAHLVAIVLLWPLMVPTAVKLAGSALLVFSLVFYLRRYALLRSRDSVSGLELTDEMACILETRGGERIACALLGSSFVAPYLTVLELKPLKFDGAVELRETWRRFFSRSVVILPDAIDFEEFRQLRVMLRWKWKNPDEQD
jgi:toxin CptA